MSRVAWPTIRIDNTRKSSYFDLLFCAVVARLAERLEGTVPEFIGIAVMTFDVIANFRSFDYSVFKTERTKRFDGELSISRRPPSRKTIPFPPRSIVTPAKV